MPVWGYRGVTNGADFGSPQSLAIRLLQFLRRPGKAGL